MASLYTKEELQEKLTNLLNKKDLVQSKRVDLLKKYSAKATQVKKDQAESAKLHSIDLEIEELERRLEKMF